MLKLFNLFTLIIFMFIYNFSKIAIAHRSGCHRWHSCPSDTGRYTCGDLGYFSQCPLVNQNNLSQNNLNYSSRVTENSLKNNEPNILNNQNSEINKKYYIQYYCNKIFGKTKVMIENKLEIDCLTNKEVIAVEFGEKYNLAIEKISKLTQFHDRKKIIALIISTEIDKKNIENLKKYLKLHSEINVKIVLLVPK